MLLRSFKSRFETDFKDDLGSIKRHLIVLESETTLAHRMEMHTFMDESRLKLVDGACKDVEAGLEDVRIDSSSWRFASGILILTTAIF